MFNCTMEDYLITCTEYLIPESDGVVDEHAACEFLEHCLQQHPEWARVGFSHSVAAGALGIVKFLSNRVSDKDKKSAIFDAVRYGNLDVVLFLHQEIGAHLSKRDFLKLAEDSLESYNAKTIDWAFEHAPYEESLARKLLTLAGQTIWIPFEGSQYFICIETIKKYLEKVTQ